jgi:hypothetical protein
MSDAKQMTPLGFKTTNKGPEYQSEVWRGPQGRDCKPVKGNDGKARTRQDLFGKGKPA